MNRVLKAIHWLIIFNFALEIGYAFYIIFFVLTPEGGAAGPLWGQAATMPFEKIVTRRLYAIEFWVAMTGLSIYLALTEIGPRIRTPKV